MISVFKFVSAFGVAVPGIGIQNDFEERKKLHLQGRQDFGAFKIASGRDAKPGEKKKGFTP